jgi:biopolymer transport protein ExbD
MRIPVQNRSYGMTFNITPLIDLVFLLNIFFLVATYFIRNEQVEPVDLPSASQARAETDEVPARFVVTISSTGQLSSNGLPIATSDFETYLRETLTKHGAEKTEVRFRADRLAPYSAVEPLLVKTAELGVTKVRFAVLQESL